MTQEIPIVFASHKHYLFAIAKSVWPLDQLKHSQTVDWWNAFCFEGLFSVSKIYFIFLLKAI